MQKSVSRRLGYLHDKDEAKHAVAQWLKQDGPMGDLLAPGDHNLEMLRNIAPVAPEAVLKRIEDEIGKGEAPLLDPKLPHRWQLTMILKSLAYDPAVFDRASRALASFVAAEAPNQNHDSGSGAFEELFQLHLSGTHALPAQRRDLVRFLCKSNDPGLVRCGLIGLKSVLRAGHFSASSSFDFGARPRDFGWHPPTYGDIWNWYSEAVRLAVELSVEVALAAEGDVVSSASTPATRKLPPLNSAILSRST